MFFQLWHCFLAAYPVSTLPLTLGSRISKMPGLTDTHTRVLTHTPASLAERTYIEFYMDIVGWGFQGGYFEEPDSAVRLPSALFPFPLLVWTWVSLQFCKPFCVHGEVLRLKLVLRTLVRKTRRLQARDENRELQYQTKDVKLNRLCVNGEKQSEFFFYLIWASTDSNWK